MKRFLVCVGLCGLLCPAPVLAQSLVPVALAEADRPAPDGRLVVIVVPKAGIEPEINLGRVISDAVYGGGLLGGLINESRDHKRDDLAKIANVKANADAAPLQKALATYDWLAKAERSSQAALAHVGWFQAKDIKVSGAEADADPATIAGTAATGQFVTLTYRYRLSPDCTQIKVIADVLVYRRESGPKNGAAKPARLLFRETIAAIAQLSRRSFENAENIAQWSNDDARLGKAAIEGAFQRTENALPYALNQSQAEIDTLQKSKSDKVFSAGFYGPAVMMPVSAKGEKVLWQHGIIDVFDLP